MEAKKTNDKNNQSATLYCAVGNVAVLLRVLILNVFLFQGVLVQDCYHLPLFTVPYMSFRNCTRYKFFFIAA